MLAYVDQSTKIKVFRVVHDNEGRVNRERLGVVRKKDFALDDDLNALQATEKSEVQEVVEFYGKAAKLETLAAVYSLPVTLRSAVEYVLTEGSKLERDMVLMSILEALKIMRRAEKEGGVDPAD